MPDQASIPKTALEAPIAAPFKNLFMLVLLGCCEILPIVCCWQCDVKLLGAGQPHWGHSVLLYGNAALQLNLA